MNFFKNDAIGALTNALSKGEGDEAENNYQTLLAENRQLKLENQTAKINRVEQGGLLHIGEKYYQLQDGKLVEVSAEELEEALNNINGEWHKAYQMLEDTTKELITENVELKQESSKWYETYKQTQEKYQNAVIPVVLTEVFSFKDVAEKESGLYRLIQLEKELVVARVKRGLAYDWCVVTTVKNYDDNGVLPFVGYSLKDGQILQFSASIVVEYGKFSHYFDVSEDAPEDFKLNLDETDAPTNTANTKEKK